MYIYIYIHIYKYTCGNFPLSLEQAWGGQPAQASQLSQLWLAWLGAKHQ